MGREIERKFLAKTGYPKENGVDIKQSYIFVDNTQTVFIDGKDLFFVKDARVVSVLRVGDEANEILNDIPNSEGHLLLDNKNVVRVRIEGENGLITIKGATIGMVCPEYNYEIDLNRAKILLNAMTKGYIHKVRYKVKFEAHVWEIDEFINPPDLVIAEIELNEQEEIFSLPEWVGEEVTGNWFYKNNHILERCQTKE